MNGIAKSILALVFVSVLVTLAGCGEYRPEDKCRPEDAVAFNQQLTTCMGNFSKATGSAAFELLRMCERQAVIFACAKP